MAGLTIAGCGSDGDGGNCTVVDNLDGTSTISCPDGTQAIVEDGTSGASCTVVDNSNGTKTISCDDGTQVTVNDGTDGGSCTVVDNNNGTKTISCDDGTQVTVSDGTAGTVCTVIEVDACRKLVSCDDGTMVPVQSCQLLDLSAAASGCVHDSVTQSATEFATSEAGGGGQCSYAMDFKPGLSFACAFLEFEWSFQHGGGCTNSWLQIAGSEPSGCGGAGCWDPFTQMGAATGSGTGSLLLWGYSDLTVHIEYVHQGGACGNIDFSLTNARLVSCL